MQPLTLLTKAYRLGEPYPDEKGYVTACENMAPTVASALLGVAPPQLHRAQRLVPPARSDEYPQAHRCQGAAPPSTPFPASSSTASSSTSATSSSSKRPAASNASSAPTSSNERPPIPVFPKPPDAPAAFFIPCSLPGPATAPLAPHVCACVKISPGAARRAPPSLHPPVPSREPT
jgi:hypothetical protein